MLIMFVDGSLLFLRMKSDVMFAPLTGGDEAAAALGALMRILFCMNANDVSFERTSLREAFKTNGARVGTLFRVNSHVANERVAKGEALAAVQTLQRT